MEKAILGIMNYQIERGLDKQDFTVLNENANIAEEMLEAHGLDVEKKDRKQLKSAWDKFQKTLTMNGIAKKVEDMTILKVVDAYADIIVFAIGAIMKLGYHPTKVLMETLKEISSRKGTMVDGKFEKDLTPEATSQWKKADYTNCKL